MLVPCVSGCGIEALPEPEIKSKPAASSAPAAPLPISQVRCEEIVKSVLEQLAPEQVGLSSDTEGVVRGLRDWSKRCGGRGKPVAVPDAFKEAMTDAQREVLGAVRIGADDFDALREATLFKAVAKVVASKDGSEREQIAAVLGHVTRTLAPAPPEAVDLPFTPSDRYLVGLGSPRDRLAVFTGILRQLRFDVAVVDLAPKVVNTAPVLLAGVILDGGLTLYDVELGVPLSKTPMDPSSPPVTLKELQEHPELLKAWEIADVGPARIDPARLADTRLHVIGTAAQWSPRLQDLQAALVGEDAIVAADVLGDTTEGPGLISRLAQASGGVVAADAITPWEYLSALQMARQRATAAQQQMLFFLTAAWGAPLNIEPDEQGQIKVIGPTRAFLRLRLALAVGGFDEVLAELPQRVILPCRGSRPLQLPNEIRFAHEDASNESSYWMGLALYDLAELGRGDYRVAGDSADRYLRGARDEFSLLAAQFAGEKLNRGDFMKLTEAFGVAFENPGDGSLSETLEKAFTKSLGKPANDSLRSGLKFLESAYRRYGAIRLLKARSLAARNEHAAAIAVLDAIPVRDPVAPEAKFWRAIWSGKTGAAPKPEAKDAPPAAPAEEKPANTDPQPAKAEQPEAPAKEKPEPKAPAAEKPDGEKPATDAPAAEKPKDLPATPAPEKTADESV